jgi:hypothetical protein
MLDTRAMIPKVLFDYSCRLHPACITHRPFSPLYPTLFTPVSPAEKTWIQQVVGSLLFYARGLDLSLLTAVYQLSSHQSNSTQHDLTSAHRLLNYVSSHCGTAIHGSLGLPDASFLSRPKSGSVVCCSVGLGDPPPLPSQSPPRKSQTKLERQTVPYPSVPPACYNPTPLMYHRPCHPQCLSSCLLPAHTRGGSVCGRGGVCCRFWRWASVGRAHAPNQPWPPYLNSHPSPIRRDQSCDFLG